MAFVQTFFGLSDATASYGQLVAAAGAPEADLPLTGPIRDGDNLRIARRATNRDLHSTALRQTKLYNWSNVIGSKIARPQLTASFIASTETQQLFQKLAATRS